MQSPGGSQQSEEGDGDPMFVIKNLDTGLEMRVDEFDRVATIAADEEPEQAGKKGGLIKGTKAFKNWTTATAKKASATAKKAVSGIKEAASELKDVAHMPVLKHRTGHSHDSTAPSRAAGGPLDASPGVSELLRRSMTEHPELEVGLLGGSQCVVPSDPSSSSQASRHHAAPDAPAPLAGSSSGQFAAPAPPLVPHPASASASPAAAAAAAVAVAAPGPAPAAAAAAVPAVPAAVRLVSHKRAPKHVEEVVLAQVLDGSCGVVWAMALSRDGSFLAAGGQDGVLRVWQLTASRDKEPRTGWVHAPVPAPPRRPGSCADSVDGDGGASDAGDGSHHSGGGGGGGDSDAPSEQPSPQLSAAASGELPPPPLLLSRSPTKQPQSPPRPAGAGKQQHEQQQHHQQPAEPPAVEFGPYFSRRPVRQYAGHAEDVVDVSWSAGGFLLTASLDKSVRLWHVSQPACLREFWHSDFVTAVKFHPMDAQRFVSGSIDGKIRIWSVTDNRVVSTAQLHQDMVTAVAFSLTGGRVLAGTMRGRVRFYELAERKLEYVAQVDARNQRGQHASGKKVTGICAVPGAPGQFLVTTNDSRLRLLEGYGQALKFKGHKNSSTQSRAALSADGAQVVCGSDDGWVYIWQRGAAGAGGTGAGGAAGPQPQQPQQPPSHQQQHHQQQHHQPCGKNAVFQAFQAEEQGVPVTAVAFVPPGACDGRSSVLAAGDAYAPPAGDATGGAGGGAAATVSGPPVKHLLLTAGFGGSIRVHEVLGAG